MLGQHERELEVALAAVAEIPQHVHNRASAKRTR